MSIIDELQLFRYKHIFISSEKKIFISENTGLKRQTASKRNIAQKYKIPTKGDQFMDNERSLKSLKVLSM